MRYRPTLKPSIIDLSFRVQAGMKVGIVGRTGSGKSSILQTLFRLIDPYQGTIYIDGTDITQIGLHKLRQSISFIPQAPFLIQGTIRENLDPFDEHKDVRIQQVLQEVQLWEIVQALPQGINTEVTESSNLFSVGQK